MIRNKSLGQLLERGFALPTIMIASVVMLVVLATAIQTALTSSVAVNAQYYNQVAQEAAESGITYAKFCLSQNNFIPQWTAEKPLQPNTDCSGNITTTCTDPFDEACYVLAYDSPAYGKVGTTFSVDYPETTETGQAESLLVTGTTNRLRSSNGETWRSYAQASKISMPVEAAEAETTWKQDSISVGTLHTCAIASDNQVYCWGRNTYGQLGNNSTANSSVPVAVDTSGALKGKTIKSVSVGTYHTCAIASDSQAYCWGYNYYSQFGDNSTTNSSVPVAVYTSGVLSGKTVKSISAGNYHTCAIASDNNAYCWGAGTYGQLGRNSAVGSSVPVAVYTSGVLSGKTIKSINAGEYFHTCAIASDNQAYCWGRNEFGQLGNNSTADSSAPVAVNTSGVLSGKTVRSVGAGDRHTCAIASDNNAYCWGWNNYGQLGNNSTTNSSVPVAVNTSGVLSGKTVNNIATGDNHACVIASDNQAYCWGFNALGRFGNNSTTDSSVPVAVYTSGVLSGKTIKSVSTSYSHTCAITSDNQAYCWGYNGYGQLGNNSTTSSSVPVVSTSAPSIQPDKLIYYAVNTGGSHNCAIASNNQVYCWGLNNYGQLGNNSTTDSYIPVAVDISGVLSGKNIVSVSVGTYHTCAITSDNQVYCWGRNTYGQLGNNSTTDSSVPVATDTSGVLSGKNIMSISAGGNHTCVIASDSQAYCWGYNAYGALGNNSTTHSSIPVAVNTSGVLSGKNIVSITAGGIHTCVIASDNQAYCWGRNAYGRLGNNSTTDSSVPVAVNTAGVLSGKTIKSISANYYHTCVVASNNQAYCWGHNGYGGLGNNSTTDSSVPVAVNTSGVLSGKTIRSISVGYNYYTCAIASDNQAYCWGRNNYGSLGNNSTTDSSVPVAVNTSGVLNGKVLNQISAGYYHTCAVASNNQAYCWGRNHAGQLGNNSTTDSLVAVESLLVDTPDDFIKNNPRYITAGLYHTCVIASDNQAYCWGYNGYGELGNNSTTDSSVPVAVDTSGVLSGKTINQISTSRHHTCAIASNNQAYCWGYNTYGQLGNNSTTDSSVPVAVDTSGVLSGKTIRSISNEFYTNCVIASNNQTYCWGRSNYGQLGNNSTTDSSVPVAVDTSGALSGKTINQISANYDHTCVIASDNQAYCWGHNNYGQLGNNSTTGSSTPVTVYTSGVFSGKTINQISAGYYHTCAVASDNQAYCWGRNDYGQLGNISTTNSSVPVTVYKPDVLINKTIDLISNSTYHTCVIASDNQAYCWGRNAYGELGNNSYVVLQSQIPITVYDMPIIEPVQSTGIYRYY